MTKPDTLAALIVAAGEHDDPTLAAVLTRATPDEQRAVADAIRSAYDAGRRDADRHSAAFVGRVFAALVGIPAGIDTDAPTDPTTIARLRGLVRGMVGR